MNENKKNKCKQKNVKGKRGELTRYTHKVTKGGPGQNPESRTEVIRRDGKVDKVDKVTS
jgi:hypothetical protein